MTALTAEDVVQATGGEVVSENDRVFSGVSIDSRTISQDELFFAIRGERFDGHDFLDDALLKGAGAVIDSRGHLMPEGKVVIYVEDTVRALQDLAHFLRRRQDIPVVAITGSNGKTTTKEMTYTILSRRFQVMKNEGNLNNHIGLPLSLTNLASADRAAVLELGMNAPGEIRRLCEIAEPTHGIITNIGSAHIGRLGSLEEVRSAKLEVLEGLTVAVLNADDTFLMEGYRSAVAKKQKNSRLVTFSIYNDSDVKAEGVLPTDSGSSFTIRHEGRSSTVIELRVHGIFNVYNALAASAVSLSLGMDMEEIATALDRYSAFPMRFEVVRMNSITVINDAYNANPSSVEGSLRELVRLAGQARKVAVLGDMLELGGFAEKAHMAVGSMVADLGVDVFVAVGELMGIAAQECRTAAHKGQGIMVYHFHTVEEAKENLGGIIRGGDVVLLKGSRAMGMERAMKGMGK